MVRPIRITAACALVVLCWALTASAARIDPELMQMLQDKSDDEILPVLMVFPEQPEIEDLEVELDGATPSKRRKSALAALKRQARKAQIDAWEILEDPNLPGTLIYADMLYLANAIAFGGDREVILAVAGDKAAGDDVILFYDKHYELLSDAVTWPDQGVKAAQQDTVWSVQYINADRVWNELGFTGRGVLIGHLDTGIASSHPDLRDRIWINPGEIAGNGLDDDGNGYVDDHAGWDFGDGDNNPDDDADNAGHGTHTAGTAVGDGSAGSQTGVAPGARILPAKVFTSGGTSTLGRIWMAQQYCIEMGCRVITMSLGIKGDIPEPFLRNDRYNGESFRIAGVTLFNSAGNEHDEFNPPIELGMTARIPAPWHATSVPYSSLGGVVTVGGSAMRSDEPYAASSRGPADWGTVEPWYDWPYLPGPGLIKPDVVAPAMGISSTLPPNLYSGETWSGTSMACPHIVGVAALMLEKNPTLSPAGIDSLLETTARDLGAPGKDVVFGAGVVDAYAAVSAVPLDLLPDLTAATYLADPDGNGVLDLAELAGVAFEVKNSGIVAASGITGKLIIESNPYVNVSVETARFPDIAAGATGANLAEPFLVAVSPAAPHGYQFTMTLIMETAEGFERVFDAKGFVGLPEHRTHDAGDVYLTVTARGSLGYLTDAQVIGDGMGLNGGHSQLFVGSLWGGNSASYMCNNDLTASGADPVDWVPRLDPVGNVRLLNETIYEQSFGMAFTDSGHVSPRGVEVSLVSRASASSSLSEVVVLSYLITNYGDEALDDYYTGLFVDWDVIDVFGNVGGVDTRTRSVWVGMPDGPVFGMALLGDAPVSNVTLIDNPAHVYPLSHVTDANKVQFLRGDMYQPVATEPTDLAALVAAGPFTLGPGEHITVAFLMGYGANADAFVANVAAAGGGSGPVVTVDPNLESDLVTSHLALAQNVPNPFNPNTEISFDLPQRGPVSLAVYDLSGRRVRTLVSGSLAAGAHSVPWDGRLDGGGQASSGMYMYQLTTEVGTRSRKMILVK